MELHRDGAGRRGEPGGERPAGGALPAPVGSAGACVRGQAAGTCLRHWLPILWVLHGPPLPTCQWSGAGPLLCRDPPNPVPGKPAPGLGLKGSPKPLSVHLQPRSALSDIHPWAAGWRRRRRRGVTRQLSASSSEGKEANGSERHGPALTPLPPIAPCPHALPAGCHHC